MSPSTLCARLGVGVVGCLVLLTGSRAHAQRAIQGDALRDLAKLSGLGVVGREIAGETECWPNASGNREASLLDSVNGQTSAKLVWRMEGGGCRAFLVRDTESERLYRGWDLPETSYESVGLVYYEHRSGFARVFEHTAPPGLWVRVADLPEGRLRPWAQLIVASPRTYFGYDGHALHEQPTEDSPVLTTLRERKVHVSRVHQLNPTGAVSGAWGEFDVIEFNTDFYLMARTADTAPTGNRWKGWLRLVNSAGSPELWFFTRD